MTTSSLAVSLLLLLLCLLLSQAQGIRLEKGFSSVRQQNKNIQEEENASMKRSNIAAAGLAGEPSNIASSGRTRKLISVTSPSSATTTSKNDKKGRKNRADSEPKGENVNSHGGEDGNGKAKSPFVSKQQEAAAAHQHYPDLADMTEMDYSPAKKKPPIHN
ncbi:uncharacterized protein LOC103930757 [Pyrus x bretschneideri]|uniref:uncharacterized protein LOC103930757 n=1 Tax=Pyrus x bretschneideri TaxID=225117 RepID=UPI000510D9C3|nr:uncharacterized protein LOC103930757 [Pyrus x bretschneideri]